MLKLLLPAALIAVFLLQSFDYSPTQTGTTAPVSMGEVIYAVQLRKQKGVEELQKDWHHDYINPFATDSFFAPLFEKIRNKEIDVYAPAYPFTEMLSKDSALATISIPLEVELEDPITFELSTIRITEFKQPNQVVAVVFHEEWFYDAATLSLEKKVKGIIPVLDYGYYNTGDAYGQIVRPLGYIPFKDGKVANKDFSVSGISYDYEADSVRLLDYVEEDKHIFLASYKTSGRSAARAVLMSSLKAQCDNSANKLYECVYPYKPVDKKSRKEMAEKVKSSNVLRFNEDWNADFTAMTFSKTVNGVYFGNNLGPKPAGQDGLSWGEELKMHAYLPLNKTIPNFAANGKVLVENYYSSTSNWILPDRNYPVWQVKDSAMVASVAVRAGELMREGKVPAYNQEQGWLYNDPLDKRRTPMSAVQIENMYIDTQWVYVEDPAIGDYIEKEMPVDKGHTNYCGLDFCERWKFDPATSSFSKDVKTIGVVMSLMSWQEITRPSPWLRYDNPAGPLDSVFQPKYMVGKNVITPCLLNYPEHRPEEGSGGRYYAGFANSYDENVGNEQRYQMVQQIIDLVFAGKMVAWSGGTESKPLSIAAFQHRMDSCAAETNSKVERGKEYYLFNEVQFDEDWYYNPRTGQMYKHVNAITFAHKYYDMSGENPYGDRPPLQPGYFTIKVNGTK